jgi:hypothetical protein
LKFKSLFRTLLAALAAVTLVLPGNASGGMAPLMVPVGDNEVMVYVAEEDGTLNFDSKVQLQPDRPDENLNRAPWIDCPTIDDPICDFNKPGYGGLATVILPPCENETAEDCIVDFSLSKSGEVVPAQFAGGVPGAKSYPADAETDLARGGPASLFRVPGAPHSGGDLYLVFPRLTLNHYPADNKFKSNDFTLTVTAVSLESPSYWQRFPGALPCMASTSDYCMVAHDFPADVEVSLALRMTTQIGGWFLGRMSNPIISIESFSSRNNLMKVTAAPVKVARFAYKTTKDQLTFEDRKATGNSGGLGAIDAPGPARIFNTGYDDSWFGLLNHFRPKVADTAVGSTTHWGLRTTGQRGDSGCLADRSRVQGIVSTNAMVYDGFAPQFVGGFLKYRVAGLHYEADGKTEVIGTYNLVMRSDTARCLYGFGSAPVSATVQVFGAAGEEKVATTIVREKDGWLSLAANGFTFSEKDIRVKITQDSSPAVVAPKPIAAPKPKTITTAKIGTKLTAATKTQIRKYAWDTDGKAFTCTAYYRLAKDKAAAMTRAKLACAETRAFYKGVKLTHKVAITKVASQDGRVLIAAR